MIDVVGGRSRYPALWVRHVLWAPVALALAACATAQGGSDPPSSECLAREGALAANATLEEAAGSYRLTLVAATGDGTHATSTGTLWLEPNEPALRRVTDTDGAARAGVSVPLYGWTDIDLAAVGALEVGEVASQDSQRPGVLVLDQRLNSAAQPSITLRLGSLANRRGAAPTFDSGYTALYVQRVDESGDFFGSWASGVHTQRVEGHFCATSIETS